MRRRALLRRLAGAVVAYGLLSWELEPEVWYWDGSILAVVPRSQVVTDEQWAHYKSQEPFTIYGVAILESK